MYQYKTQKNPVNFRLYLQFYFASCNLLSQDDLFFGSCVSVYKILFFLDSHISIELVSKQVKVSRDMAIFVTMNPGYAGRSNLPDNLKKLFRSLAMTSPDRQLIAQVMLYSQGFRMAEKLASKIVPFFK